MARVLLEMLSEEGRASMPTSKVSLALLGLAGLLTQALGVATSAQGPEILLTLAALAALTMSQTTPRRG